MNSRSRLSSFGRVRIGNLLRIASIGVALQAAACSSDDGPGGTGDSGGRAGSAGSAGSSDSAGSSGGGGDDFGAMAVGAGSGDSSSGSGTPSNEDTCDGLDNDGNGIIDDVDTGHDGICDCLRIATLGEPGEWGEGDVFATWLNQRSINGAVDLRGAELTAEELAKHQVIVIQDVSVIGRTYSDAEVEALSDWVSKGGGLMTLIGYGDPDERENVNTLLAPLGIGYGEEQILGRRGGSTNPITAWSGGHPVLDGITAVGVDNGYPVVGEGATLATGDGHDVLKALETGNGRVLVWGDEWITYNSEWVDHPDYQVERFWLNAIKWLTPANECQVTIPPQVN
ncbi:hypothetical protein WME90_34355 [Sorangium sp. So ce375]|uniref:hypothetical protein n=1 Tax=Sorangium sp. So ce375 TaxID=3133306 RepID=UPI003F5BA500